MSQCEWRRLEPLYTHMKGVYIDIKVLVETWKIILHYIDSMERQKGHGGIYLLHQSFLDLISIHSIVLPKLPFHSVESGKHLWQQRMARYLCSLY